MRINSSFGYMLSKETFPNWPFNPNKSPVFYGWVIIFIGTLGITMSIPGQTMGVSTFTDSLIDVLGMTRNQLSFAYMCGTLLSASLLTWVGRKYDQFGARPIALISTISLGAVLIYLSQIDEIQKFFHADENSLIINFSIMFLGFFALRFAGQGALTMVSRNMMMKWFEARRGFAMGFSSVATSLSFSSAPVFFELLIHKYDWDGAWVVLAILTGVLFPVVVIIFFRDDPLKSGLKPDGGIVVQKKTKVNRFPVVRDFTLSEAQKTIGFWVFSMILAMQALYWTGFTFNIVSLFEAAGYERQTAVSIFLPSSVIAVLVTLSVSSLSDYIKLKYLLYVMGTSAFIALTGMIYLGTWGFMFYLLILGNGIMMGLYSVILSVTWPRFFGKTHLGAISGRAITFVVVGSAIGPLLFSFSLEVFDSYSAAGWVCLAIFALLTVGARWANNPQEELQ